jgi:hypothetical protein
LSLDDDGVYRTPPVECPSCGHRITATAVYPGQAPKLPTTGDWIMCFDCANVSIFEVSALGVALRRPTPEEKAQILHERGQDIALLLEFNERVRPDRRRRQ